MSGSLGVHQDTSALLPALLLTLLVRSGVLPTRPRSPTVRHVPTHAYVDRAARSTAAEAADRPRKERV
ncbi:MULTISPECIES: hypothetical protein [unclassified Streptomyces]|jgi:hypothetical protein|uniref:Secreted protein n=1 Tax=Streptomyces thermocoprophilus TaxID=78356 RepID=A0ABV5VDI5_9ACTN|nr:hypothetical protein [Streptomyces sp. XM83C]